MHFQKQKHTQIQTSDFGFKSKHFSHCTKQLTRVFAYETLWTKSIMLKTWFFLKNFLVFQLCSAYNFIIYKMLKYIEISNIKKSRPARLYWFDYRYEWWVGVGPKYSLQTNCSLIEIEWVKQRMLIIEYKVIKHKYHEHTAEIDYKNCYSLITTITHH